MGEPPEETRWEGQRKENQSNGHHSTDVLSEAMPFEEKALSISLGKNQADRITFFEYLKEWQAEEELADSYNSKVKQHGSRKQSWVNRFPFTVNLQQQEVPRESFTC